MLRGGDEDGKVEEELLGVGRAGAEQAGVVVGGGLELAQ